MKTRIDLTAITEDIVAFRDERDWKQFHNPKDLAVSLVLEASEVLEHFQWKSAAEMEEHLRIHKEDVADEMADTLYWILLMANDFDVDLVRALEKKMEKNRAKYPTDKAKGNHMKYNQY